LRESELREPVHDVRPRKGFGQEYQTRMFFLEVAYHTFPKIERLRMWVVYAENIHTLIDPEFDNGLQLLPERFPLLRTELERVNVLIFLRRIFRVLNRSVRTPSKPFRMLPHIWMVRRVLVR